MHQDPRSRSASFPFRAKHEITTPYYYSVELDAGGVAAHPHRSHSPRITAGSCNSPFLPHSKPSVVVEATRAHTPGFVHIDPAAHEIVGYNPDRMDAHLIDLALPNFKGYFVVKFKRGVPLARLCIGRGPPPRHGHRARPERRRLRLH